MKRFRTWTARWEFAAAVSLLIGFAASWRLQFEPGTIGLFHDWSISPTADQNVAYASQLFDGWYRWILGEPVIYPTEYPVRFAFAAAGLLGISGDTISHAFVFFVPALAFLTAWLLTRQLSGSNAGSIAGGALYALSPVMFNKMVSGQASYVVGYCALPLVLWSFERAMRDRSLIWSALFGTALALAGVQLQLGLLGAFVALVDALIPRREVSLGRRLLPLVIGFSVAAVIQLPTLVGIAGGAPGYENRAQFANSTAYLSINSVSLSEAVRLMGYLTRYADIAIQSWAWLWNSAMYVLLAAILIGIVTSPKRFRILAGVLLVAIFLLVSGTQSPVAGGILWLFAHVRYMQVFRELYHLMAGVALMYACGVALFFRYASAFRFRAWICAVVTLALLLVCAPMMSGDASGWMKAFPIRQAYGDALDAQMHGAARVLWLPMDQPLSFEGDGAGVDPMAVSRRGTLWDYALNWPMTAVDTDVHDGGDLGAALRALSVGDVVTRFGMQSQLARFTADPIASGPFLARSVPVDLPVARHYRQATGYRVPNPIPYSSRPSEIALVPQRLSVCAQVLTDGYAPLAFSTKRPAGLPYAMLYDVGDIPEEALELAGVSRTLPSTAIDARVGFAPSDVWWWHRREYADVPSVTLTFGRHAAAVFAQRSYREAVAVVAWIATPVGGRLRISEPGRSIVLDTNGSGEWRSRAVPLGALAKGTSITLASLDPSAEVAVRAVTVIDGAQFHRLLGSWRRTLNSADVRVAIAETTRQTLLRTGSSNSLGRLLAGHRYRLVPAQRRSELIVKDASGYLLARITPSAPFFGGIGTSARIVSREAGKWKLFGVSVEPLIVPAPRAHASARLLLWNWAFGDWQTNVASQRLRSATGTTIFVFSSPQSDPVPYYSKTPAFHAAYVIGVGLLLSILAAAAAQKARRVFAAKTSRVKLNTRDVQT